MQADLGRVEEALRASVRTSDPFLTEVASHLIEAGGKRGRPAFCLGAAATTTSDLRTATDDVVMGAVSVELVHLGSLYHDDVMDEATTRRTVESVNARWSNLTAILAGDFLLAKASEIAASLGTEVAGLLAATIGRLCEGQVLELQRMFDPTRTEADYLASIGGKTAALFATACRIGGIVGGMTPGQIDDLTAFGHGYGMAFQIVDDVLDVTATAEQLGKPAGHDLVEGVYTLPVIRILASDTAEAVELKAMLGTPLDDGQVATALDIVRSSPEVDGAMATARTFVDDANTALGPLADTEAGQAILGAADHLLRLS